MNTNMTKLFALFLLASFASTTASCGEGDPSSDIIAADGSVKGTETASIGIEMEEIDRENAKLGLPEIDFGGQQFNILYVGDNIVYRQDIFAEETGDVVDDAVFNRNISIEELLNCKLNPIAFSDSTTNTANHIAQTVLAGDDLYDLCSTHQSYTVKYVTEGYFHNFSEDDYIDWNMPWWNTKYMNEMVVGNDKVYFLMGDISLMRMKSLAAMYFNRDLYESLYGDPDALYDTVFEGKWTFDKFGELVRGAYADLNGNASAELGDRFGAFGSKYKSVEHFQYACGVTTTTKNNEGIPELTINNERTVNFVEDFYELYYENEGFIITTGDDFHEITNFMNGEFLFCPVWFRHADQLREMKADYGIVNFPKYEEKDEYQTLVHNGTTIFCTPVTSKQTDKIGAVCEAMGYFNYTSVTPSYYEVALKVKYSRDDKASQVLDLISDSAYTNFGYVYSSTINGLGTMRSLISAQSTDFASWYAGLKDGAQEGINKLVEIYQSKD